MREEPVEETDLIDNDESERKTYQPGGQSQSTMEANKAAFGKRKWGGNRYGDQHHPCNGTDPKYQEI